MAKHRVLIVEDEQDIAGLIKHTLERSGSADAEIVHSGDAALKAVADHTPDLIILDLNLPVLSGIEVCRILRARADARHVPIIMLTARTSEDDRVTGLELGADDYVTKPFSPRELVLRIRSILRRANTTPESTDLLRLGDIQVDRARYEVLIRGKSVDFTATEFKLLTVLMERRGRVQSRDTLLNDVWGYESVIDTRTVDTHVRRLREKLGKTADCIETIRGFGYRMVEA